MKKKYPSLDVQTTSSRQGFPSIWIHRMEHSHNWCGNKRMVRKILSQQLYVVQFQYYPMIPNWLGFFFCFVFVRSVAPRPLHCLKEKVFLLAFFRMGRKWPLTKPGRINLWEILGHVLTTWEVAKKPKRKKKRGNNWWNRRDRLVLRLSFIFTDHIHKRRLVWHYFILNFECVNYSAQPCRCLRHRYNMSGRSVWDLLRLAL